MNKPVAWIVMDVDKGKSLQFEENKFAEVNIPLYTHPAEQKTPINWIYDNGKWQAGRTEDKIFVESSDFTHDVRLYVDGDFEDTPQKYAYATEIAKRLNVSHPVKDKPHPKCDEACMYLCRMRELTDEEIMEIVADKYEKGHGRYIDTKLFFVEFAKAILRKAQEK